MTIVVTGASGHIGGNLVRALLERGEQVRCVVHRDTRAIDGLPVETVSADVCDEDAIVRATEGATLIYHLAAVISIDGNKGGMVEKVNVGGTRNVARAALTHGARLLYTSSIHAMQQFPLDVPIREDRPRVPWGDTKWPWYDRTKAQGEREVRALIEQGLDAVIFHPTGVIGPHDYGVSRLGRVWLDLWHGRLPSLVDGGFDWVDVRDVVDALLTARDPARGRCGQSYLLTGTWKSVAELAAVAEQITGRPAPRLNVPRWLAAMGVPFFVGWGRMTGKEPLYTFESLHALHSNREMLHEKASEDLGFAPRPFEVSAYDIYRWHREAGNIPADARVEPIA
ncbi:MAG: NAD-dependent epimerase/dehydratase family protein [Deltaproteobacteria bacterium]|nr:NAD-dependent epimerase/dehydratase family protein [Deltaproteobacteria bacterium]